MVVWYTFEGGTGIFFHLFPLLSHLFLWVRYFLLLLVVDVVAIALELTIQAQLRCAVKSHTQRKREREQRFEAYFFFCVGPISATGQTSHRPHFTNSPFCWTKSLLFPTMRVSEGMDNSNNNRGHEIIESGVRFFFSLFFGSRRGSQQQSPVEQSCAERAAETFNAV